MGIDLETAIKNTHLTKIERKVAEYILANTSAVCFQTASDIAKELDISDSSVIRFCRTLGYRGFPSLQKDLQEALSKHITQQEEKRTATYMRLPAQPMQSAMDELINNSYSKALKNLEDTCEKNPPQKYEEAAKLILSSDRKRIIGFRGSSGSAQHFGVLLTHMMDNVTFSTHDGSDVIEKVLDYGEKDCIILFACERYNRIARMVADMARESGCKLIVITDKLTSPVAFHADIAFVASAEGSQLFHSFIGFLFIAEALSNVISNQLGSSCRPRMERMEKYISMVELY